MAINVVKKIEEISVCKLTSKDVVRASTGTADCKGIRGLLSQRSRVAENTVTGEINMTLNYEEEGEVKPPVDCEGLAKEVIEAALDYAEMSL